MDNSLLVVVNPKGDRHQSVTSRFPQTIGLFDKEKLYKFPHPEVPAWPQGSTPESILYSLGHKGERLASLTHLSPSHIRQLREALHTCRTTGSSLHLFGVLDNESPFGSRRFTEALLRILRHSSVPIVLHLGVWHMSPRELRYALRELEPMLSDTIRLQSLYPISSVLGHASAKRYIDGLHSPARSQNLEHVILPLTTPLFFGDAGIRSGDRFFVLNHELHGQTVLEDELSHAYPGHMSPFMTHHSPIIKPQAVTAYATRPSYVYAYFGTEPSPEIESHIVPVPSMLEGLTQNRSGQRIAFIDESASPHLDKELHYLFQFHRHEPMSCMFLEPTSVQGNILITTQSFTPTESLYSQWL